MKILQIEIGNYRLIKAMLLELDGKNLAVAGPAGQGKTTAISVLWEALKTVGDPITHGERKGQIRVTLGDGEQEVFVTRSFTAKTSPITITTSKGHNISAAEFATWFCDLGSNPHKIMDMKPKEQTAALLEAVRLPEGVDLEKLDADLARAEQERLELHRDGKRDAEALGAEPPRAERVDTAALLREEALLAVKAGERSDRQYNLMEMRSKHARMCDDIAGMEAEVKDLASQIERMTGLISQAKISEESSAAAIAKAEDELRAIPEIDQSEIRGRIQYANDSNRAADRWEEWNRRAQSLELLRADYKEKDLEVKDLVAMKRKALADAVWPLPGLSIVDGVINYNGSPLDQCGHSEQMLVCGVLAAETIGKHKLRVVRMDGIESMSKEDFRMLEKVFAEHDIQVLSSRVSRGDVEEGEIQIVDGSVSP